MIHYNSKHIFQQIMRNVPWGPPQLHPQVSTRDGRVYQRSHTLRTPDAGPPDRRAQVSLHARCRITRPLLTPSCFSPAGRSRTGSSKRGCTEDGPCRSLSGTQGISASWWCPSTDPDRPSRSYENTAGGRDPWRHHGKPGTEGSPRSETVEMPFL